MNTPSHLPGLHSLTSTGFRTLFTLLAALLLGVTLADAKPAPKKPRLAPFLGHTEFQSTVTVVEPGVRWIVQGTCVGHEVNIVGDFTATFFYDINLTTGFLTGQIRATDLAGDQFGGAVVGRLTATGSEGFVLVNFGTGRYAHAIGLASYKSGESSADYKGYILLGLGGKK